MTSSEPLPPPSSWAEVIDRAKAKHDTQWSTELERIARNNRHRIGHTAINKFARNDYPSRPGPRILAALSFLSGVPLEQLEELAGTAREGPRFADQVAEVEDADLLEPDERLALLTLLRRMVKTRRQLNELVGTERETGTSYLTDEDVDEAFGVNPVSEDNCYPPVEGNGEGNSRDRSG